MDFCFNYVPELTFDEVHGEECVPKMDIKQDVFDDRCHAKKTLEKGLFKDVENMGFDDDIVKKANEIFVGRSEDKIFRNQSRKAKIFACFFEVFKNSDKPQLCENLIKIMGVENKKALSAINQLNLILPKNREMRHQYITPEYFIKEALDNKFHISEEKKKEILKEYEKCKEKATIELQRAKPQSLALAIIYYWMYKNGHEMSLVEFSKLTKVSTMTIKKIHLEITRIL